MLRMYLLQVRFNPSNKVVEDVIDDRFVFRKFIGVNFVEKQIVA